MQAHADGVLSSPLVLSTHTGRMYYITKYITAVCMCVLCAYRIWMDGWMKYTCVLYVDDDGQIS